MAVDLRIAGGDVMTPGGRLRADVLVDGGRIAGVVEPGLELADTRRTVDATERLVVPGMVDPHVHTREPGFTHKEDIATTTEQAAAGGVTTIFGMPNLEPATTNTQALDEVLALYEAKSIVDYCPPGGCMASPNRSSAIASHTEQRSRADPSSTLAIGDARVLVVRAAE